MYFAGLFVAVGAWIVSDLVANKVGLREFDPPPFPVLQGVLTFLALITATVVLIGQRRQTKLAEQHAHLDLQINLLTEQKVTRLIHMLDEPRNDLPMLKPRIDGTATEMKEGINAAQVISVLKKADLGTNADAQQFPNK